MVLLFGSFAEQSASAVSLFLREKEGESFLAKVALSFSMGCATPFQFHPVSPPLSHSHGLAFSRFIMHGADVSDIRRTGSVDWVVRRSEREGTLESGPGKDDGAADKSKME